MGTRQELDRRRREGLAVEGKTFGIKDILKEAGAWWDNDAKLWLLPNHEAAESLGNILTKAPDGSRYIYQPAPTTKPSAGAKKKGNPYATTRWGRRITRPHRDDPDEIPF